MKNHFKVTTLSAAIMATFIAMPTYAVEEAKSATTAVEELSEVEIRRAKKADIKKQAEIEVIEVTGFAGSLRKAMNAKRFSDGVSDSIHAEDVGKSTDQNIADALSRVTGISVQETDGEGSRISVRGTSSSLNQVSLNGMALTSGGNGGEGALGSDQSVDLSAFSSDVLSSIDVQKTAAADQDEGSLGANILLRTVRPLNVNNERITLNAEGRYNEFSGDDDRRFSASILRKFLDDKIGVIFTITDETQGTRSDIAQIGWTNRQNQTGVRADRARDFYTGELMSDVLNVPGTQVLTPITMSTQEYRLEMNQRDRLTATLGLQYAPTDDTEIMLDLNYSKQEVETNSNAIQMQNIPHDRLNCTTNPACVNNGILDPQDEWHTIKDNVLVQNLERNGRFKIFRNLSGNETENKIATLNITHSFTDDFTASALVGYSKTEANSIPNARVIMDSFGINDRNNLLNELGPNDDPSRKTLTPTGVNCGAGGVCDIVTSEGLYEYYYGTDGRRKGQSNNNGNVLDPNLLNFFRVRQIQDETSDENKSLFLDFDWALDNDYLTSFEFGGKWTQRTKSLHSENLNFTGSQLTADAFAGDIDFDDTINISYLDLLTPAAFPVDDFMQGVVKGTNQTGFLPNGWGVINPLEVFEIMQAGDIVPIDQLRAERDPGQSRDIQQTNTGLYAKLNFELLDGNLTGNFGIRHVRTKNQSSAFQSVEFVENTNAIDFHDLLVNRQLANGNLAVCDYLNDITSVRATDDNQYSSNLPASGTCSDTRLIFEDHEAVNIVNGMIDPSEFRADNENLKLWINYGEDGSYTVLKNEVNTGRGGVDEERVPGSDNYHSLIEWADRSTNPLTVQPSTGQIDTQADARFFRAKAATTQSVWLPSLSLNYTFSDELIGRMGISKTMARPPFDDVRPSGRLQDNVFNATNQGDSRNPLLNNLESKNLDLSLEWYFSNSGLLSAAFFYKDMSGFTQDVTNTVLLEDIRDSKRLQFEANENGDVDLDTARLDGVDNFDDLLITPTFDAEGNILETPDNSNCYARRVSHAGAAPGSANPIDFGCRVYSVVSVENTNSTTKGIELSYTQNYDFLPGVFSGLGVSMNYTYADSETDPVTNTEGITFESLPQPYTPAHSANTTVFWEKDGLMLRLAHRYTSVQLVDEIVANSGGTTTYWLDHTNRLDFSASYRVNEHVSVVFNATNLTDEIRNIFVSSRDYTDIFGEPLREGNIQTDSNFNKNRIRTSTQNGRIFRLGIRANF